MKIVKQSVLSLIISLLFVTTASASLLSVQDAKYATGISLPSLGSLGDVGGDPISDDLYTAAAGAKSLAELRQSQAGKVFAPALIEAAWAISH